jgi:hypothetical protein
MPHSALCQKALAEAAILRKSGKQAVCLLREPLTRRVVSLAPGSYIVLLIVRVRVSVHMLPCSCTAPQQLCSMHGQLGGQSLCVLLHSSSSCCLLWTFDTTGSVSPH